jgi:seryl-tRNA synthetase
MWQTILAGQSWSGELVNRRKDGRLFHEFLTIAPMPDAAGQPHRFIAIKQDISARKREEEAVRQAHHEIERLLGRGNQALIDEVAQLQDRVGEVADRSQGQEDDAAEAGQQVEQKLLHAGRLRPGHKVRPQGPALSTENGDARWL